MAGARALLARRGGLATALEAADKARQEARRVSAESGERLAGIAEAADVSGLSALLETTPGDLDSRVEAAARSAEDAARERERLRRSLSPALPDTVDPAGLPVPPRGTVGDLRDRLRHCRERWEDNARRLDEAERALERDRKDLERRIAHEGVATALRDARARRDDLWTVVRPRHIDDAPVPEDLMRRYDALLGDPVGAFEEAGRAADAIADRRFDKAEAAGRLAELGRTVEERAVAVEALRAQRASLAAERDRLEAEWSALWRGLPVEAGPPDAMLEWLDAREAPIAAMESRRREAARLAGAERAREEARGRRIGAIERARSRRPGSPCRGRRRGPALRRRRPARRLRPRPLSRRLRDTGPAGRTRRCCSSPATPTWRTSPGTRWARTRILRGWGSRG